MISGEMGSGTTTTRIIRSNMGEHRHCEDLLAVEEPLEMAVSNGDEMVPLGVTFRTPGRDEALVAGFLYSEGIVKKPSDIISIDLKEEVEATVPAARIRARVDDSVLLDRGRMQRVFPISAACGACGKSVLEALRIERSGRFETGEVGRITLGALSALPATMREVQARFEETGGIHAAARFDRSGRLLAIEEDIGRHNALDKLIGDALLNGDIDWSDQILLLSGRVGYDLMQKAIQIGCPFVVSIGAASSFAVELSNLFNVTLVGFLRSERCNVYSAPERIQFDD